MPFRDERIVINPDYARGMSTPIQTGLRAVRADAEVVMIVLGDHPFVALETISLDRRVRANAAARAGAGVPRRARQSAIVARALFAEMMDVRGDVGFRAVFARYPAEIVEVAVDERGVITDVDTPAISTGMRIALASRDDGTA